MDDITIHGEPHVFIPHPGIAEPWRLSKLELFAEYLSQGYSPSAASFFVYGTSTHGNSMVQRLRGRLGPQAR